MGDLIDRQAAIDAFDGVKVDEKTEYDIGYNDGIDFAVSKLSVLPSAQQWIPVTERLPEMTDTYLVQVGINENGEGMHTEARTADWNTAWHTWYVHTTRCLVGDIIKWMPIPWEGSDRHEG